MTDPRFFRRYLDIIDEATPTTAGVTNPNVDPNITKQAVDDQIAQQQTQQDKAEQTATAQQRGAEVQAMQKAGMDKKTVDMYASGDLQGVANQAAGAVKTLPSKADLQRMGKETMASKQFASLPKAQQDELKATYAQVNQMPDDYREQGAANFKQVANLGAQDKADKTAGKGFYAPAAQVKSRVEPKYTEKDIQDLEANKYAPSGSAGRNIAQKVAAAPVSPTAPTQTTTNLQVAKNPETGNPKLGSPLEVAPTQPQADVRLQQKPVQEDDLVRLKELLNRNL